MKNTQLKTALSSKIANILRQEIYENTIKIGEHLNEVAIASRLGVSRGPLRDAIRILENEGLVSTPSNGRTVVKGFSSSEIIDYYKLRYFIESEAIRKILSEPDNRSYREWLNGLEELLKRNRDSLKYDDKNLFAEADYQFHFSINKRANNVISLQVWKMLANMSMTIIEMNKQYMADNYVNGLIDALEFHDKVLLGLKKRDLDMALKNLKMHMEKGENTFFSIIKDISRLKVNG